LEKQLICAAAEVPLNTSEPYLSEKSVKETISRLEKTGELIRSGEGNRLFSRQRFPHRSVNLRDSGEQYTIISQRTGKRLGEINAFRAFKETYPGAVYLHQGETYVVSKMDIHSRTVFVSKAHINYYTKIRGHKNTEIIEKLTEKQVQNTTVFLGRLKVTDQVTGYEKWSIHGKRKLNGLHLDLPPLVFETEGFWIKIPRKIQQAIESQLMHFMGGIHAIEHALIGMMPLLIMADRNDFGGISVTYHQQVGTGAVFVYDGNPGGAGLCSEAFSHIQSLFEYTLNIIRTCPCESGCPSCVHSPKCGSGNRPIDKQAACCILEKILAAESDGPATVSEAVDVIQQKKPSDLIHTASENTRFGVLDLETQRSAQEVGGWHLAGRMGISCGVLYDSEKDDYIEFLEDQVHQLIDYLQKLPLVVGFNINRFDYRVLQGYANFDFGTVNTLDLLEHIHRQLNFRLSLDHLAKVTLGVQKSADGLQALRWWKEGKIRNIVDYCKKDVEITKDLYLFGKENGFLLYTNKAGSRVRVPVSWKTPGVMKIIPKLL
jgi:DEAD/DEAH box helicase domain-containing protein